MSGSNCDPAHRSTSATAQSDARARYGRADVIASNASTTARSRASIGISRPARCVGIAAAVPPLVMEEDVGQCGHERGDPRDQPRALDRMGANLGELGVVEPAGLAEHVGADVDLAHVVSAAPRRSTSIFLSVQPSRRATASACAPTREAWPSREGSQTLIAAVKNESRRTR